MSVVAVKWISNNAWMNSEFRWLTSLFDRVASNGWGWPSIRRLAGVKQIANCSVTILLRSANKNIFMYFSSVSRIIILLERSISRIGTFACARKALDLACDCWNTAWT